MIENTVDAVSGRALLNATTLIISLTASRVTLSAWWSGNPETTGLTMPEFRMLLIIPAEGGGSSRFPEDISRGGGLRGLSARLFPLVRRCEVLCSTGGPNRISLILSRGNPGISGGRLRGGRPILLFFVSRAEGSSLGIVIAF